MSEGRSTPGRNQIAADESGDESKLVTFGELFDVKLGGVTGDSDYFLLTESRRRQLRLPERVCTPVLTRAKQLIHSPVLRSD